MFITSAVGTENMGKKRTVLSLDGTWLVTEGGMDQMPASFTRSIPVPGLADMAEPPFEDVGMASDRREAFWYRRTFTINAPLPPVALLKVYKARYGMKVFVNGQAVGEHYSNFTPGYFDVRELLNGPGEENELTLRIGAFHDVLPPWAHWGWDNEKIKYIPGIYDSVELILTGHTFIQSVQVAPDPEQRRIRVLADLLNGDKAERIEAHYAVREKKTGKVVAQGDHAIAIENVRKYTTASLDFHVAIPNGQLWSPENPFLYELEIATVDDAVQTSFGLRSFRFDTASGRALLNGKPYYLRGSNITLYRFFEDPERAGLPWDREWVRNLHRSLKGMNGNMLRYCIGFPPEFWYDIADEEGILIQDEFPIWYGGPRRANKRWPAESTAERLAEEFRDWMQERWNHPSVVIWDAQNETVRPETGAALSMVRHLDLSNRPWDNGWSEPQHPDDVQEAHPYLFSRGQNIGEESPNGPLSNELTVPLTPHNGPQQRSGKSRQFNNAVIINEYAWIWLNRDGSPTTLTDKIYPRAFPDADTPDKRRYQYARWSGALTEYWRAHRRCAGVLQFCLLGYSRPTEPRGQTSDFLLDVPNLVFEPHYETFLRDALAPVGLMVNYWNSFVDGPIHDSVDVYVINDLEQPWEGEIRFRVETDDNSVMQQAVKATQVEAYGREIVPFTLELPAHHGLYRVVAEIEGAGGKVVRSLREVTVR